MNQLKQILGLPITISNGVRSSSLSRSAGRNGRSARRSGERSMAVRVSDDSPELRLSERSYARLIADCSRAMEEQNAGTKCSADQTGRGTNIGLFAKTPFERLANIPSMMKIKNGPTNAGSSLSTKSSSKASSTTTTTDMAPNSANDPDRRGVLADQTVTWFDKVETDRAKSTTKNYDSGLSNDTRHQSTACSKAPDYSRAEAKSEPSTHPQSSHLGNKKTAARNVSVTVKALEESDGVAGKLSVGSLGDNAVFLVTVTEESTSNSSPLRNIDLRINGEPPSDTVIRKVEKLDIVSMAEKIEIRIPVLSDNSGNEPKLSSNSTINLFISSGANGSFAEDSGRGRSRAGSARSSTFHVDEIRSGRKSRLPRSKVVPWWTTEESFRRSEMAVARSCETGGARTCGIARVARGNDQRADQRDAREVGSDTRMRTKTAEESGSWQRSRNRRKAASPVSRIVENELRKNKSAERQRNAQHRGFPAAAWSVVKHATKVKSSASNQPRKGTSSASEDESAVKSERPIIHPTPGRVAKKIPTTVNAPESVEATRAKSVTVMANDSGTNDHLSNRSNSKESLRAKPISLVANETGDDKTGTGAANAADQPKALESATSKTGSEAGREITHKSEAKVTPESDTLRLPPTTQSPSTPANRPYLRTKQDSKASGDVAHQLSDVKNPSVLMKPIEKKKDGTLIDYGLTVPTRKKPERKLPDAQSAVRYKISKKEEPVIVATIKEVISTRNKGSQGGSVQRGIVYPAKLKQNGPVGSEHRPVSAVDRKHHPCKSRGANWRARMNVPKDSKISEKELKIEKKSVDSSKPKNSNDASAEKKLLYSAWLRRIKERDDHDPDGSPKGSRGAP